MKDNIIQRYIVVNKFESAGGVGLDFIFSSD